MSFEDAATISLTASTAVCGLYAVGGPELCPPWEEGGRGRYADQPIVILGAGSNVGTHGACVRDSTHIVVS